MRKALSLREARERLSTGRGTQVPSMHTVRVWANVGYKPRGWTGEPVILRTVRLGPDLVTCEEWIEEFERARWDMGELVRRTEVLRRKPVDRPRRTRKASQKAAASYLDRMGCK